jgi:HPt (histidine-containing phosphotransfer) domain-containing protein
MNEMFRRRPFRQGAAMLGYSSIQNTAHRLEDAFKILKENPIEVD